MSEGRGLIVPVTHRWAAAFSEVLWALYIGCPDDFIPLMRFSWPLDSGTAVLTPELMVVPKSIIHDDVVTGVILAVEFLGCGDFQYLPNGGRRFDWKRKLYADQRLEHYLEVDMRYESPRVSRFELRAGPFYTDVDDAYGAALISEVPYPYTIPPAALWR